MPVVEGTESGPPGGGIAPPVPPPDVTPAPEDEMVEGIEDEFSD